MHRAAWISLGLIAASLWVDPAQAQQADTAGTGGLIGSVDAGALFGLGAHGAASASLLSGAK